MRQGRRSIASGLPETEAGFQRAVRELARAMGWKVSHTYLSIKSPAGFPDLVLVKPPHVLFAELKTAQGRVNAAQQGWLEGLEQCPGIETYLWRPCHWPAIVERLSR